MRFSYIFIIVNLQKYRKKLKVKRFCHRIYYITFFINTHAIKKTIVFKQIIIIHIVKYYMKHYIHRQKKL